MQSKGIPVFPNWFPYNDMVLDGHLKVDQWEGVKTRNWEWNYRGPVLFYNSLRTAKPAVEAYQYVDSPSQHKIIIGIGELVDVRPLTHKEALQMVCNFNNMSPERVEEILQQNGSTSKENNKEDVLDSDLFYFYSFGPYVAPLDTGFFFKYLQRFRESVPFNWPSGPIKPIFTKIVPGSKLYRQIKLSGF